MIDANTAHFKSKYQSRINDILDDCEKNILGAVEIGEFTTTVNIYIATTPEDVFKAVVCKLNELGYETNLHNERILTKNAPCDQCAYWEALDISWDMQGGCG